MNFIQYNDVIYETKRKSVRIYDATIHGAPCYLVHHPVCKYTEILSHDEGVINAVINRAKKSTIVIDEVHGYRRFCFARNDRYKKHSLRDFVYCKYNGLKMSDIKGRNIVLKDKSLRKYGILDIRKENLYNAGGENKTGIRILCNPNDSNDKYIAIDRGETFSIQDYSPRLYEMLTHRKYTNVYPRQPERQNITVNYSRESYKTKTFHLSKFILLYYRFFHRYERTNGCIKKFLANVNGLSAELGENVECGHINAESWNNSACNMLPMLKRTNLLMKDYYKDFVGDYDLFAIAITLGEEKVILVEFTYGDKCKYWLCKSPEEYSDLQRFFTGHADMTKNTKLIGICEEHQCSKSLNTPKQEVVERGRNTFQSSEEKEKAFWTWCDRRDALIELYKAQPNLFQPWYQVEHVRNMKNVMLNLMSLAGAKQCFCTLEKIN